MSRRRSQTNSLKRIFPLILVTTFFFVFASQTAQAQAPFVTSAGGLMTLQYSFGRPTVTRVDPYDSVKIRGLSKIRRAGEPVLPVKPVTILIPHGRQLTRLEVVPGAKVTLPGRYDVEPGQRPVPLSHTGPVESTPPAPRIYNTRNPFPGVLNSEVLMQSKRGFRLVVLNLYPVEYVPSEGALSYYREMTVRVHTEAIAVPFNQQRGFKETEKTYIRKIVDNPETADTYPGDFRGETSSVRGFLDPGDSYQYIIITNEALSGSAFTELAANKNARGITAKIVTTEWIYANYDGTRPDGGTDNQTRIRNFIIDAYTTWGTEYVLLGGNKDIVPPRLLWVYGGGYTDQMPADLYYGCLDGSFDGDQDGLYGEPNDGPGGGEVDLYHEVYIGRASVEI